MSTSSAAALPTNDIYEDLLPPYHAVSPGNKGAYALLTAVILIIIVGLAVSVKLQMTVATFRKLRYDDYTIIASMVRLLLSSFSSLGLLTWTMRRS